MSDEQDARKARQFALHLGIAERGKLHALAGDHREALLHYRAAIRLAVEQGAPEVFFRHYTECVLESLELTGSFAEVIDYCDRAIAHYGDNPPAEGGHGSVARHDFAHVFVRRGVCRMKQGPEHRQSAQSDFEAARKVVGPEAQLPLLDDLLKWLRSGWHIDSNRIVAQQKRHNYFSVRKDQVDPDRAIDLPTELRVGLP